MNLLLLQEIRLISWGWGCMKTLYKMGWTTNLNWWSPDFFHQQLSLLGARGPGLVPKVPWARSLLGHPDLRRWAVEDPKSEAKEGMMCVGAMGNPRQTFIFSGYKVITHILGSVKPSFFHGLLGSKGSWWLNQPILMPQSRLWWISAIHWKIRTFPSQSQPISKISSSIWIISPGFGVNIWKKYWKPPTRNCIDCLSGFSLSKLFFYLCRKGAIILFSSVSFPKSSICFLKKKNLPSANGLAWCFGARWFGFRLDPLKRLLLRTYPDSNPKPPSQTISWTSWFSEKIWRSWMNNGERR